MGSIQFFPKQTAERYLSAVRSDFCSLTVCREVLSWSISLPKQLPGHCACLPLQVILGSDLAHLIPNLYLTYYTFLIESLIFFKRKPSSRILLCFNFSKGDEEFLLVYEECSNQSYTSCFLQDIQNSVLK